MLSWICVCDFFLVQELCLQTTLLPVSGKELKSQLRTGCTACIHDRSYQSGIFSAPIWEIQSCFPSLRCFWRTTGSICITVPTRLFPRLVREFYGDMIIIQDDDRGLIMQTMVRGQTILIDPQLISLVVGVLVLPVLGVPFPVGDETPNIDFLRDFFGTRPFVIVWQKGGVFFGF
jgi:hypothetical protein